MTDRDAVFNWNNGQGSYPTLSKDVSCSAPTQSLLQKWLREVHEINVFIYCYGFGYYPTHDNIHLPTDKVKYVDRRWNTQNSLNLGFETYEQALEIGLQEALKLIETTTP